MTKKTGAEEELLRQCPKGWLECVIALIPTEAIEEELARRGRPCSGQGGEPGQAEPVDRMADSAIGSGTDAVLGINRPMGKHSHDPAAQPPSRPAREGEPPTPILGSGTHHHSNIGLHAHSHTVANSSLAPDHLGLVTTIARLLPTEKHLHGMDYYLRQELERRERVARLKQEIEREEEEGRSRKPDDRPQEARATPGGR